MRYFRVGLPKCRGFDCTGLGRPRRRGSSQRTWPSFPNGIQDADDRGRTENNRGNAGRFEDLPSIECHAGIVGGCRTMALIWIMGLSGCRRPSHTAGELLPATPLPYQPLEGSHGHAPVRGPSP
jgi:hypothetical protein